MQQQEDQTRRKSTKLDVQSIMEAAFEMRRRVMEDPDSSDDDIEEDEEDDWS